MLTKNNCMTCSQVKHCRDTAWSWIFFLIGMIATFSVRLVVVFINYNFIYAKVAWYVGVLGFFVFFLYKFRADHIRSRIIFNNRLVDKIKKEERLTVKDYSILSDILCSLSSSKDRVNYFIIFSTSIITVLFSLYEDFVRR